MADYQVKRNDRKPIPTATLTDVNGAVDLTLASSVKFIMKVTDGTVKINSAGEFVDKAAGKVKYTWAAGDTDTEGVYSTEWEITWGTGELETFPNDSYLSTEILKDLA